MKQSLVVIFSFYAAVLAAQFSTFGVGAVQQSAYIAGWPLRGIELVGTRPLKPRFHIEASSMFVAGKSVNGDSLQIVKTQTHKHQITFFYKVTSVKSVRLNFGLGVGAIAEKARYPELIDYLTTPVTIKMQSHQFIKPTIGAALSLNTQLDKQGKYHLDLVGRLGKVMPYGQPIPDAMSTVRKQFSSGGWSITTSNFPNEAYFFYSVHIRLLKTLSCK